LFFPLCSLLFELATIIMIYSSSYCHFH
jgi:hypothetical protein